VRADGAGEAVDAAVAAGTAMDCACTVAQHRLAAQAQRVRAEAGKGVRMVRVNRGSELARIRRRHPLLSQARVCPAHLEHTVPI
jgi:hypothetical protein